MPKTFKILKFPFDYIFPKTRYEKYNTTYFGFTFFEINMFINLKAKVAPTPRQNFQKLQQRRKNSQHFPNK